ATTMSAMPLVPPNSFRAMPSRSTAASAAALSAADARAPSRPLSTRRSALAPTPAVPAAESLGLAGNGQAMAQGIHRGDASRRSLHGPHPVSRRVSQHAGARSL